MKSIFTDKLFILSPEQYPEKRFMQRRAGGGVGRSRAAGLSRALTTLLCLGIFVGFFAAGCVPEQVASVNGSTVPTMMPAASEAVAETIKPVPDQDLIFQNVAEIIGLVFQDTVSPADMRLSDESWGCTVEVHGNNTDEPAYYAYVNRETSEVEHVVMSDYADLPLTDAQRAEAEGYDMFRPKTIVDEIALEWSCAPVARELVERVFANGRTILETPSTFSMTDIGMEPRVQVGINVHMDTGACYVVTMIWPQLTVSEFSIYPLGWESCVYGYTDASEAKSYKPLGNHMIEKSGETVMFDSISYYYLPTEDRQYYVTPAYRYDYDADYLAGLADTRLGETEAWAKAEAALNTLVPEYSEVPGRFVVEERVHGEGP